MARTDVLQLSAVLEEWYGRTTESNGPWKKVESAAVIGFGLISGALFAMFTAFLFRLVP